MILMGTDVMSRLKFPMIFGRMLEKNILDLRGVHVLATGLNRVIHAPQHGDKTLLVHHRRVAGVIPAAGECARSFLRQPQVLFHQRWAAREKISCYRVYDADLPEFSFALDLYQGDGPWLHLQE